MGSLNHALMSQGPCRLARTNILLSAVEAYVQGGISADILVDSIDAFEAELAEENGRFQELAAMPNESEAVQIEIAGVKSAYDLHEDVLTLFSEILEGEVESEELANAKKMLVEASEKLSDHKEALTEIGENEGKISCVRCGSANEPGSRVCGKCGAQLPQQASSAASTMSFQESDGEAVFGGELEMTTNLERLFQAVNDLAEEKISDEEFEEVLVWMDNLLADALETMPDVPDMTNHPDFGAEAAEKIVLVAEDLSEQRESMLTGMAEFREALGTLQSFFETRDNDSLIQGIREVKSGAVKMQQSDKALTFLSNSIQEATQKAIEESKKEQTD